MLKAWFACAVVELELLKAQALHAGSLWMDPAGSHVVCTLHTSAQACETHYVHARWRKARVLGKLKNVPLSCLAWNLEQGTDAATGCVLTLQPDKRSVSLVPALEGQGRVRQVRVTQLLPGSLQHGLGAGRSAWALPRVRCGTWLLRSATSETATPAGHLTCRCAHWQLCVALMTCRMAVAKPPLPACDAVHTASVCLRRHAVSTAAAA